MEEQTNGANIEDFVASYRPAIKIHEVITIEDAHVIINCNLRLKQIMDKH